MDNAYPLHITRALAAAETACAGSDTALCHTAVMRLYEATVYYLGAIAVAQYSQAHFTGQIEADPTLNRSLRSLRRLLPGQWLGWTSRGLAAATGPVEGLAAWYSEGQGGEVAAAYDALRRVMQEHLQYTGEYGPRDAVSPRLLLEIVDQYRIRRAKAQLETGAEATSAVDREVSASLLPGLRSLLGSAPFLSECQLYAPVQRQMLMGNKAATPMPPISAPTDAAATLLLYPPGELPDYTKRPNLRAERLPLFPLDPLLAYLLCPSCDRYRIAALQEVIESRPAYLGLDPDCGHSIQSA